LKKQEFLRTHQKQEINTFERSDYMYLCFEAVASEILAFKDQLCLRNAFISQSFSYFYIYIYILVYRLKKLLIGQLPLQTVTSVAFWQLVQL
jgi:hypothetical protein